MNRSRVRPARVSSIVTPQQINVYERQGGGGVRTQRGGDLSDETTDELLKKITDLKVTNQERIDLVLLDQELCEEIETKQTKVLNDIEKEIKRRNDGDSEQKVNEDQIQKFNKEKRELLESIEQLKIRCAENAQRARASLGAPSPRTRVMSSATIEQREEIPELQEEEAASIAALIQYRINKENTAYSLFKKLEKMVDDNKYSKSIISIVKRFASINAFYRKLYQEFREKLEKNETPVVLGEGGLAVKDDDPDGMDNLQKDRYVSLNVLLNFTDLAMSLFIILTNQNKETDPIDLITGDEFKSILFSGFMFFLGSSMENIEKAEPFNNYLPSAQDYIRFVLNDSYVFLESPDKDLNKFKTQEKDELAKMAQDIAAIESTKEQGGGGKPPKFILKGGANEDVNDDRYQNLVNIYTQDVVDAVLNGGGGGFPDLINFAQEWTVTGEQLTFWSDALAAAEGGN